jgi:hypothetical protein
MKVGSQMELKTKTNWHPNASPLKAIWKSISIQKGTNGKPYTKISRQQLPSIKSPKGIELDIEDPGHPNKKLLVKKGNKNKKVQMKFK